MKELLSLLGRESMSLFASCSPTDDIKERLISIDGSPGMFLVSIDPAREEIGDPETDDDEIDKARAHDG
jgi:hypothetical protein